MGVGGEHLVSSKEKNTRETIKNQMVTLKCVIFASFLYFTSLLESVLC